MALALTGFLVLSSAPDAVTVLLMGPGRSVSFTAYVLVAVAEIPGMSVVVLRVTAPSLSSSRARETKPIVPVFRMV